ncbi:MAG: NADH:flavin oxidoreductase [Deltaproteobacteria bacterium]|nr:NADH:flavin oxidoreductase [Deltaproteobacteria bacterium]
MYESLFEPIKIGPLEIKNRLAVAPMNMQGDRDGHPTLQYTCCFNARALGGFGLMTTGSIFTSKTSKAEYAFVPYINPFNIGYFTDFTESIHSMGVGAKIFGQLSPGFGRQTGNPRARGASAIPFKAEDFIPFSDKKDKAWNKFIQPRIQNHYLRPPREMTIDEIKEEERCYVRGAEWTIRAGFDGIEIHAPHGYLLHQFLSPRSNQRKDEYGGSLRNRARYLLELLTKCKENFGDAVPIVVRLSGREYHEGGLSADDVRQICIWCEEAGADAISLSNGSGYDDPMHMTWPEPDNLPLLEAQGKKLKEVISIPVITVGLHTPAVAAKAVEAGETDMVAMGRQSLADPQWPNKVKEGRIDEITRCKKDNYCMIMGIRSGMGSMRCNQNPNYGKEQFIPEYWPKPMRVKVPETLKRWAPGKTAENEDK